MQAFIDGGDACLLLETDCAAALGIHNLLWFFGVGIVRISHYVLYRTRRTKFVENNLVE